MKYYFEYNHAPAGDKYCIMTKAEYELAKRDPTRWFIDFGNCVIECSKAERTEYYRMYYRYFNSRKCKNGRDADMVSLNSVNEAVSYGMSVFAVHNEPTIDDIVICRMYQAYCKQRLIAALETLSSDEVYLVQEMTLKSRKQKDLAAELGISQQAVSKKYLAAMRKLRQLLSDLKG